MGLARQVKLQRTGRVESGWPGPLGTQAAGIPSRPYRDNPRRHQSPYEIIAPDVIYHARRQEGRLWPANANLGDVIRHKASRTRSRKLCTILPNLNA